MSSVAIRLSDGAAFTDYDEVLAHIHHTLHSEGIVKQSYLAALREREALYPTGILLDGYAVAIPHCDTQHANSPCVYIIRLPQSIEVNQADGDDKLSVRLIINLVVTDPASQLQLPKALFSHLQIASFYQDLLTLPVNQAKALFVSTIMQ